MMKYRSIQNYRKSQGVVLIVALVLLLALTLIGVSAVDSSSLQSQMSRNSLYARNLYQASLSEIQGQREAMKNLTLLANIQEGSAIGSGIDGITYAGPGLTLQASTSGSLHRIRTDNGVYNYSGYLAFSGETPPPSGYSIKLFKGMAYEVNAISQVPSTPSISDQTQGLKRAAPRDQE